MVSRDEIRANDYNLNIPRYVDSSEKPESWDIYASMFGGIPVKEIEDLDTYWTAFPGLKYDLFSSIDGAYLKHELIQGLSDVNISKEESVLSEEIFFRLNGIPLMDVYEAYQILDNNWNKIAVDLEIIQTEGFEATKQVDPNMVIKKKDGKDQELQDGWAGHVFPFELVQAQLLSVKLSDLKADEERAAKIIVCYEEELDALLDE